MNREELKQFLDKCYGYTFRDDDTIMNAFDDIHTENENYHEREENLIKYLEDKIKECDVQEKKLYEKYHPPKFIDIGFVRGKRKVLVEILERLKSGKYE